MPRKPIINEGGIIGSQDNPFNTSSEDFLKVREMIIKASMAQSPREKRENITLSFKFRMESYLEQKSKEKVITASDFLKQLLHELNIKHRRFASYVGLSETNLSAILAGKRKISEDLALRLEQLFNIEFDLWLKIQNKNDWFKIRETNKNKYKNLQLDELVAN